MDNQRAMHAWHNQYRVRRTPRLGELLDGVLKVARAAGAGSVSTLMPVWDEVIPLEVRSRAELLAVSKGCVTIEVRDTVTRFELERSLGPVFIDAVRRRFPELGVRRLRTFLRGSRRSNRTTEVKE
jgi:hypothetical protein